jgi:hypothetical protein
LTGLDHILGTVDIDGEVEISRRIAGIDMGWRGGMDNSGDSIHGLENVVVFPKVAYVVGNVCVGFLG